MRLFQPFGWLVLGGGLICLSLLLKYSSKQFGYDVPLEAMPIVPFVMTYSVAGLLIPIWLIALIRKGDFNRSVSGLLMFVVLIGLIIRLMQLGAEPVLEDDFYRYLWDGAVIANGYNPYQYAPQSIWKGDINNPDLLYLAEQGHMALSRVNYPNLRTVYPPAAQAIFALSYWLKPFSIDAWRVVLIVLELGVLTVILAILRELGRSPLYVVLYWWHPLTLVEVANSAHMEPVLMLPVMVAVWCAISGRSLMATALLSLGAGVKLWPVFLLPVLWRQNLSEKKWLLTAGMLSALIVISLAFPVVEGGLDQNSGFVAFARNWSASSGVSLVTEWVTGGHAPYLARAILAIMWIIVAFWTCRYLAEGKEAVVWRLFILCAALYLLSPSQTPWYFLWILPFLCIFPIKPLLLAGALIPLHYLYFALSVRGLEDAYRYGVVWVIWLPVWGVLLWTTIRWYRTRFVQKGQADVS